MDQGLVMVDSPGAVAVSNQRAIEFLDLPVEFMASRPSYLEMRQLIATGRVLGLRSGLPDWVTEGGLVPAHRPTSDPPERNRARGPHRPARRRRRRADLFGRHLPARPSRPSRLEARYRLLAENGSDIIMLRTLGGGGPTCLRPASRCWAIAPDAFLVVRART